MNTRNIMVSSYHSKVRYTQHKRVISLFCLGHGLQYYFPMQVSNQQFFQATEVSWNLVTSISISSKTRKRPQGENFGNFVRTAVRMKYLTQIWTQSGPFFPKLKHFFDFYKKVGEASPLTLVARLPCLDEAKVSNINSDLTWMKT